MSNTLPSVSLPCMHCGQIKDQHDLFRRNYKFYCKNLEDCDTHYASTERTINAPEGYVFLNRVSGCYTDQNVHNAAQTLAQALDYEMVYLDTKWGTEEIQHRNENQLVYELGEQSVKLGSDLNINANAMSPLTGTAGIAGQHHLIVPHPVLHLETTASPAQESSKILMTTGHISQIEDVATTTRASATTQFHAIQGVVLFEKGDYPLTFIPYEKSMGGFVHKNWLYTHDGQVTDSDVLIPYVYLPDMHLAHPRPEYQASLFDELRDYQVNYVIGGDMFDGSSMLHHEKARIGYYQNKMSIFEELQKLYAFVEKLDEYTIKGTKLILGNHETFCDRFFGDNLWQELKMFSKEEQVLLLKSLASVVEETKRSDRGIHYPSLLQALIKNYNPNNTNVYFSDRTDAVDNVLLWLHGHEYLANKAGASNSNHKMVVGHTHSPKIWRNITWVGYGGHLEPTYQNGITKAAAAHCFVSASGKRTLRIFLP
jgi:hypothetical protein